MRQLADLHGQHEMVAQTYRRDVLKFEFARGCVAKLLDNKQVVRYRNHPNVCAEFETIVQVVSLKQWLLQYIAACKLNSGASNWPNSDPDLLGFK